MRSLKSIFALRKSIFICHASDDADIAESIALRLRRQGFKVFLDRDNLQPAHAYDDRIHKEIIDASSMFIFLVSPHSVETGRYTLTEMEFAKQRWPDPHNAVLPVMIAKTDMQKIPPYLRAVTFLQTEGNAVANVAAEVARLAPRPINTLRIAGMLAAATGALIVASLYFKPVRDLVYAYGPRHRSSPIELANSDVESNSNFNSKPEINPKPGPSSADPFPANFDLVFSLELADDTPYLAKDQVHIVVSAKRWENYIGLHPTGSMSSRSTCPARRRRFRRPSRARF
jgi:hypothetical protein